MLFLSTLNRSTDDEMARITERGSQHAAAAWLCVANHAVLAEDRLHARQQVRQHQELFMPAPVALKIAPHILKQLHCVSDTSSIACHVHNHYSG